MTADIRLLALTPAGGYSPVRGLDCGILLSDPASSDFVISRTAKYCDKAAAIYHIMGQRTVFNAVTPFQDFATYLTNGQNGLTVVSPGTEYFVVSTSATDVAGSAGVSKVRIVYLDAAGVQRVKSATLNGTTKVSIGSGYLAFQWMESSELGTAGATSAVGNISIFSGVGVAAAESTTVEQIQALSNRSLTGRYTVPYGHTGYLISWDSSAPGSQAMDARIRAECFTDDRSLSPGIFHFQGSMFQASTSPSSIEELRYQRVPALAMTKISCYPAGTTGTPRCDATFHILVVAD